MKTLEVDYYKFCYLGTTNIIGTELSAELVKKASKYDPNIKYEVADILQLDYSSVSFGSAVAFYTIFHFD